jgi:hypothetical protein
MDPPSDEEIIPMFEHALKIGEPVQEWVEFWKRRKESNARLKASGVRVHRD